MRLQGFTIAGVATLLIYLLAPTYARKAHHYKSFKHHSSTSSHTADDDPIHSFESNGIEDNDADEPFTAHENHVHIFSEIPDKQEKCHKASLHKCGPTFLRAFKLLSYLTEELAFKTKCSLRTAFFSCLKQVGHNICKNLRKHKLSFKSDPHFSKKLADALWSTRVCVLGTYHSYLR